jgi:hypothetical protein
MIFRILGRSTTFAAALLGFVTGGITSLFAPIPGKQQQT